jgi:RecA/RadA recombinase
MTAFALLEATSDVLQVSSWYQALRQAACMRYLPTGLAQLDSSLLGGIRVGTMTELVGPAGSGKTQLAMQAIVMAASYRQGAIYVDTEQKLSLTRLQEIASARFGVTSISSGAIGNPEQRQADEEGFSCNFGASPGVRTVDEESKSTAPRHNEWHSVSPVIVLENLTVHTPASMDELKTALGNLEEEILMRNQDSSKENRFPVRLLILDSIAAPARRDFSFGSVPQRAAAIMHCAQTLKRLADQFHLAVLVINQVGSSDVWNSTASSVVIGSSGAGAPARAALGTAWHHCVTTRIQLELHSERSSEGTNRHADKGNLSGLSRSASVVKSNSVGQQEPIAFTINNSGFHASR